MTPKNVQQSVMASLSASDAEYVDAQMLHGDMLNGQVGIDCESSNCNWLSINIGIDYYGHSSGERVGTWIKGSTDILDKFWSSGCSFNIYVPYGSPVAEVEC